MVAERALDRNDLERERGITILAKCTSVVWKGTRINIVDTPGHADFGGEVERILNMVDGAIVLVDAAEGVLPQTKFVVGKALARGLHPIVVVNKVDRADARPDEVHTEVFDLFAALGATDEPARFPDAVRLGPAGLGGHRRWTGRARTSRALFDLVRAATCRRRRWIPTRRSPWSPRILEYDNFLGRVLTGRVEQGRARINMPVKVLRADGTAGRDRAADQAAVVPRPRSRAGRGGRGRRHHRRRRPGRRDGAGHDRRAGTGRAAARHPGRSADPGDDLPHQRRPAGRARGQEGHLAARSATGCSARPRATSPSRSPTATRPRRSRSPAAASCSSAC